MNIPPLILEFGYGYLLGFIIPHLWLVILWNTEGDYLYRLLFLGLIGAAIYLYPPTSIVLLIFAIELSRSIWLHLQSTWREPKNREDHTF